MSQTWILYPLFVMFLLSVFVGLRMLQLRFRAVMQDNLNPVYFKLNRGGKPPAYMAQAEQHFTNLYETPLLFYVVIVLIYVLSMTDIFLVALAWLYVASRFIHAHIHMNNNKILRRRNIFLGSIGILSVLWTYVFMSLMLA